MLPEAWTLGSSSRSLSESTTSDGFARFARSPIALAGSGEAFWNLRGIWIEDHLVVEFLSFTESVNCLTVTCPKTVDYKKHICERFFLDSTWILFSLDLNSFLFSRTLLANDKVKHFLDLKCLCSISLTISNSYQSIETFLNNLMNLFVVNGISKRPFNDDFNALHEAR